MTQADIKNESETLDQTEAAATEHVHGPDCSHQTVQTYVRGGPKLGRNDPCSCGSGKKFKKCCGGSGHDSTH